MGIGIGIGIGISMNAQVAALPAPIFRASAILVGGSANTASPVKPTGTVENDILLYVLYREIAANDTVTWPTGFTQIGALGDTGGTPDIQYNLAWKRAGGSEPASYAASWLTVGWREALVLCYSGCVQSGNPHNVAGVVTSNGAVNGQLVLPEITTTISNALLVALAISAGAGAYTQPTGMTEDRDSQQFGAASQIIANAGATGSRTWTRSLGAYQIGQLVALRP